MRCHRRLLALARTCPSIHYKPGELSREASALETGQDVNFVIDS
jgi:hypothetical protein